MVELLTTAVSDAVLQVGAFVAPMLLLVAWFEHRSRGRLAAFVGSHRRLGPLIGAVAGVSPGCGGALLVIPLYGRGRVSFGTVVAALVATMGDSSFVLIAANPGLALKVHAILFVVGVVTGTLVDLVGFKPTPRRQVAPLEPRRVLPIPAGGAGDASPVMGGTVTVPRPSAWPAMRGALIESVRITALVAVVFVAVELVLAVGFEVAALVSTAGIAGVLIGAAIGIIPGCAPQIVITGLHATGVVPFATLLANALSQDGDALLPMLLLDRRAAVIASLVTTVPAVVVGAGVFLLA